MVEPRFASLEVTDLSKSLNPMLLLLTYKMRKLLVLTPRTVVRIK